MGLGEFYNCTLEFVAEPTFLGEIFPLRKGTRPYVLMIFLNLYNSIFNCSCFLLLCMQQLFANILQNLKRYRSLSPWEILNCI